MNHERTNLGLVPLRSGPRPDGDRPRPGERHGGQRRDEPHGAERPEGLRPAQRRGDDLVRRRRDHRLEQLPDRGDVGRRVDAGLDGVAGPPRHHRVDRLQLRRFRCRGLGDGQALLRRRLRQGTRRDRRRGRTSARSRSIGHPPPRPRHHPLVRRRHPAPGADRRPPLLRGPAAPRRRRVVLVGRHDVDPPDHHLAAPVRPRGPRPGARPGRQLGRLEGRSASTSDPAAPRARRTSRTPCSTVRI